MAIEKENVKNPITGYDKTTIYIYAIFNLGIGHSHKMARSQCQTTNNNKSEANLNLIRRI